MRSLTVKTDKTESPAKKGKVRRFTDAAEPVRNHKPVGIFTDRRHGHME